MPEKIKSLMSLTSVAYFSIRGGSRDEFLFQEELSCSQPWHQEACYRCLLP